MRKYSVSTGKIFWLVWLVSGSLWGHGVHGKITLNNPGLQATYADGSAMAECEYKVFGPESYLKFSGLTDHEGCLAFTPDRPGLWKMVVNDGMGHQLEETIQWIDNGGEPEKKNDRSFSFTRMFLGVSLIFNICCFLYIIRRTGADGHASV